MKEMAKAKFIIFILHNVMLIKINLKNFNKIYYLTKGSLLKEV